MVVATGLRLNLGAGDYALPSHDGWVNVDASPHPGVSMVLTVPPLPWPDGSVASIYAGHFLEHLDLERGRELLVEAFRVLESGGTLGIVVPDFREMARRYVAQEAAPFDWSDGHHDLRDLDELCRCVIFSTVQPTHHLWAYDLATLERAVTRAGFEVTGEIDRYTDPRLSSGQWYQTGLDARKP